MSFSTSTIVAALLIVQSFAASLSTIPARAFPESFVRAPAAASIARAQFTSGIKDREPTDSLTTAGPDKPQLYFFTELRGMSGGKVTHRWEHAGKVEREQTFDVGADRWRAWSNKNIAPTATGEWKVTIVDGTGATLGTYTLTYGK